MLLEKVGYPPVATVFNRVKHFQKLCLTTFRHVLSVSVTFGVSKTCLLSVTTLMFINSLKFWDKTEYFIRMYTEPVWSQLEISITLIYIFTPVYGVNKFHQIGIGSSSSYLIKSSNPVKSKNSWLTQKNPIITLNLGNVHV